MKRILVVDDELDFLRTIQAILEGEGYEVTTADDGEAAAKQLARQRPDLLLADVMLPYRSGLDLVAFLRTMPEAERIPAVLMSVVRPPGQPGPPAWQAFLQKPFTLDRLLQTVERLIGKADGARSA